MSASIVAGLSSTSTGFAGMHEQMCLYMYLLHNIDYKMTKISQMQKHHKQETW